MFLTEYCAATDVGLQRNNNEDCHIALALHGLWVVADGMGGHAAGEVASAVVCNTIQKTFLGGSTLIEAIQASHKAVLDAAENGVGGTGMGSTVVALASRQNHYEVGWVGDSRAYLFSPGTPYQLKQLTKDHSYVQMLLDSGAIRPDEFANHPEKNIITQCLGSLDLDAVDVGRVQGEWAPGQIILLCSDGLTDAIGDVEIGRILGESDSLATATDILIKSALNKGGRDNITVQLISAPNRWTQHFQTLAGGLVRTLR